MSLLGLHNELKALICAGNNSLWALLAISDESFYNYTRANRKLFVDLCTVVRVASEYTTWSLFGMLHREDDLPAKIYGDGTHKWYLRGELHRANDMPAEVQSDGSSSWYIHGSPYRQYGQPTYVSGFSYNGSRQKRWHNSEEQLHRVDGPALIAGDKMYWFTNGKQIKMYSNGKFTQC